MPIRPEERDRYPADWRKISDRIRFGRARHRCECTGQCGQKHEPYDDALAEIAPDEGPPGRCPRFHEECIIHDDGRETTVILTVAHLDHMPENCADDNLLAMCQRCHLAYDREHHRQTQRNRRAIRDLFDQ